MATINDSDVNSVHNRRMSANSKVWNIDNIPQEQKKKR